MKVVLITGELSYNVADETHEKIKALCEADKKPVFMSIGVQNMIISVGNPVGAFPIKIEACNPISIYSAESVSLAIDALYKARAFVEANK